MLSDVRIQLVVVLLNSGRNFIRVQESSILFALLCFLHPVLECRVSLRFHNLPLRAFYLTLNTHYLTERAVLMSLSWQMGFLGILRCGELLTLAVGSL